jgi:hypothetical protein
VAAMGTMSIETVPVVTALHMLEAGTLKTRHRVLSNVKVSQAAMHPRQ